MTIPSANDDSIIGANNAGDLIDGLAGNDTIDGRAGDDTLFGNLGNDSLLGGAGFDQVDGGPGNDTLSGGFSDDTVLGGDGDDFTFDQNGNDSVSGGNGNDTLQGQTDNDTLIGDAGDDSLDGGNGTDSLLGGVGDDTLVGGAGADVIRGGPGTDLLSYISAAAAVAIDLGAGTGTGDGDGDDYDEIEGVVGSGFNDTLIGGAAAETIEGGFGPDTLTGNGGNDTFRYDIQFSGAAGIDRITDFSFGDSIQIDLLDFTGSVTAGDGSTVGLNEIQVSEAGGVTTLFIGRETAPGPEMIIELDGSVPVDELVAFGDRIFRSDAPVLVVDPATAFEGDSLNTTMTFTVRVLGGDGGAITVDVATDGGSAVENVDFEDLLLGTLTIPGGADSAPVDVQVLGDLLIEGDETFTLQLTNAVGATIGTASITGTIVDDEQPSSELPTVSVQPQIIQEANSGIQVMRFTVQRQGDTTGAVSVVATAVGGSALADVDFVTTSEQITIGAGVTTTFFDVSIIPDTLLEGTETFLVLLSDPEGAQIADIPITPGFIFNDDSVTLPGGFQATVNGGDAAESLEGGAQGDLIFPGGGNDTVEGAGAGDAIEESDGNDLIFGDFLEDGSLGAVPVPLGSGGDVIEGGNGADTVFAGAGSDQVLAGDGDDFIIGQDGNDIVLTGNGNDVLFGGNGADYLFGEDATDFLFGDAGANTLDGGSGNDRVHLGADDVVAAGGEGIFDVLVLLNVAASQPVVINLGSTPNQSIGAGSTTVYGFEAVDASIADAPVALTGAVMNQFGNVLFGGAFADTIIGSAAADIILGGGAADSISAGPGNDTITADTGNDTISGGSGADNIGFLGGLVSITDFEVAADVLQFFATGSIATAAQARAAVVQVGADSLLVFDGGNAVTFVGVNAATFNDANFVIV